MVERYPLLPLRDVIIFPYMAIPLFVGRPRSIRALEEAVAKDKMIFLAAQRDSRVDDPELEDLYPFGTLGQIMQMLKLPDGTFKILLEGKSRARIAEFIRGEDCLFADIVAYPEVASGGAEVEALMRSVGAAFENYVRLSKKIPPEVVASLQSTADPSRFADTVISHLSVKVSDKQEILQHLNVIERLDKLLLLLERETEILQIEKKIRNRVKNQVEKSQKEYYLNEQMRAIQSELGEKDEFKKEFQELEKQIVAKKMSKEATAKALSEFRKLKMMSPMSAEAAVVRNYIDCLVSLPWQEKTRDALSLPRAEAVLEEDHFGLDKVKERIIEYLAVRALAKKIKGPILCLVGPPGVGKTSLGRSIARALGRKFVRISLGGVRDEAEIRGHRRTYIGSMPGKIIQGMRKAEVRNPVFLLDEVDKMNADFRGDPSSALLEVLDPEQNRNFGDHFVEVDYDLSDVFFIATANSLHNVPRPLQDRMEVIRLEGYTEEEKLNIAKRYLISKQAAAHGIRAELVTFSDSALFEIIRHYTQESGVRHLEREISNIFRKLAREFVKRKKRIEKTVLEAGDVRKFLGVPKYRFGIKETEDLVGAVNGLAWTEFGGELLTVEVSVLPGQGKLTVTGKLGEVMKESAQAALSYVRSRWAELGLEKDFYQSVDIHIHVPEGAIPKDGPSAGITMATALASALTGKQVDRDLAMTGEITLRGRVLEIGGLKEKLLAARRAGLKKVLIPRENEKNLEEIPAAVRDALEILPVAHMDEVLENALLGVAPREVGDASAKRFSEEALSH
ncbi:MAG: endopeptidase La [Deltaproteobacteria bacterium]|nr:endopeptidase La [Deltaproteobacteria bacterium]